MSYPVVEQIAQAIKAQLETITVANGYELDLAGVVRPKGFGLSAAPDHLWIVLAQGDEVRETDLDVVGNPNGIGVRQPFQLGRVIRLSDASEVAFDQVANIFSADVVKAMMADVKWAGLAIDTEMVGWALMKDEELGYEGKLLQFDVIYRVAENDPYTTV